jgi:hypothetical protein
MDTTISPAQANRSPRSRWPKVALLSSAIVAIFALLLAYQSSANRSATAAPAINAIPTSVLEERYGLRVNLIAVTAAGGLVDVRLKVLDAEKAKALLKIPQNFPALKVGSSDVMLTASEDSRAQVDSLKDGGLIMILFPNRGSAVNSGSAVNLTFGDMQLESIAAR